MLLLMEGVRLWGAHQESTLHTPPRSAADAGLQVLLGAGSFSCSPLLSLERKKIQGSWGQKGDQKVCVCARVSVYLFIYICIYKYAYVYRHTRVYTHTCKMTPALSGWECTWEREPYPPIPCVMDHYGGFVSGFFFHEADKFMKKVGENTCKPFRPLETLAG